MAAGIAAAAKRAAARTLSTRVAQTGGTAIVGNIGKITAAINRTGGAGGPQRLALRVIGEPARNLQLGVEREQQRQSRRPERTDVLVLAAVPPHTPQALVVAAFDAEHDRV